MAAPEQRLQLLLARALSLSRRSAEALLEAGRVQLDGENLSQRGLKLALSQLHRLSVDGRPLPASALAAAAASASGEPALFLALHKPRGVLSALRDDRGRATLLSVLSAAGSGSPPLSAAQLASLKHVDRLDLDSEGLLLLTSSGEAVQALSHPSRTSPVRKTYIVSAAPTGYKGREPLPLPLLLPALLQGVDISGLEDDTTESSSRGSREESGLSRPAAVCSATVLSSAARASSNSLRPGPLLLELQLEEGRKRQLRRMLLACGWRVQQLLRTAVGPIGLEDLQPGQWRLLRQQERAAILQLCGRE
jgi:23S rRNA pseudouridine2605 synthase